MCCLQACLCALFSPENLRAGAVKGLIFPDTTLTTDHKLKRDENNELTKTT